MHGRTDIRQMIEDATVNLWKVHPMVGDLDFPWLIPVERGAMNLQPRKDKKMRYMLNNGTWEHSVAKEIIDEQVGAVVASPVEPTRKAGREPELEPESPHALSIPEA